MAKDIYTCGLMLNETQKQILEYILSKSKRTERGILVYIGTQDEAARACGVTRRRTYEVLQLLVDNGSAKRMLPGIYELFL